MYLSAERLALANQTALETFEQCSIAWQAIPHWDTGDPAQTRVRNDVLDNPDFLPLVSPDTDPLRFQLTLAQTSAPTPDSLLAEVMAKTAVLAKAVDDAVIQALFDAGKAQQVDIPATPLLPDTLKALITAREKVEDAGYRAPSCLIANTAGLVALSDISTGYPATEGLLAAANANSLHRATKIDKTLAEALTILVLGRRQLIPHGCAAQASPGEEPVDHAVSVLPSVEIVGETAKGEIELDVRIRYALRVKQPKAVAAIYKKT
jgi:hypothetical protein